MALELVAEIIGAPLIDILKSRRPGLRRHAATAVGWLRDRCEPPEGVELRSHDGSSYTGLVVVERNELVMMIAVKHPASFEAQRPPVITPAPRHTPPARQPFSHTTSREDPWEQGDLLGDPLSRRW